MHGEEVVLRSRFLKPVGEGKGRRETQRWREEKAMEEGRRGQEEKEDVPAQGISFLGRFLIFGVHCHLMLGHRIT